MKLSKASRRDRKRSKRRYGMMRDGDSVKLIQKLLEKRRAELLKKQQEEEEAYGNSS